MPKNQQATLEATRNAFPIETTLYPGTQPGGALVEVIGIEPTTSCLQSRRSPN